MLVKRKFAETGYSMARLGFGFIRFGGVCVTVWDLPYGKTLVACYVIINFITGGLETLHYQNAAVAERFE